jgi:hypothetical protein
MKTPAQVINDKKFLEYTIEQAKKKSEESGNPLDEGMLIGLQNAYTLIYDKVYGTNGNA